MSKVLVERARQGGKYARVRKYPKHKLEDAPTKESMKFRYKGDRKSLNENLSPLKKFLNSKVGKHWDKVWSEICENLKLTSAVQKHVRDHVKDFVYQNVFTLKSGKVNRVYHLNTYYRSSSLELRKDQLYVDPTNGVLKRYRYNEFKYRRGYSSPEERLNDSFDKISNEARLRINKAGELVKLYRDNYTEQEVQQKALAIHAKHDFSFTAWNRGVTSIHRFFEAYPVFQKSLHPYWVQYRASLVKWEKDVQESRARAEREKVEHEAGK